MARLLPSFLLCATILLFRTTFASDYYYFNYENLVASDADPLREALPYLGLEKLNSTDNPCLWPIIICEYINNKTRVTQIDLNGYGIVGSLPPSFGDLEILESLTLNSNFLTGSIPDNWRNFKNLYLLDLSNNSLNGTVDVVGKWTKLVSLSLNSNHFSGEMGKIPVANLSKLSEVFLDNNDFTGPFPDWMGGLSSLRFLSLGENLKMSPSYLPSENSSWPDTLINVNLSSMNLIGSIPEALRSRLQLISIDLSNNSLNGSVDIVGNWTKLKSLSLNSNHFDGDMGTIPIGNLGSLYELFLDNNDFTGPFPNWIGKLSSLEYLSLGENLKMSPSNLPSASSSWPDSIITVNLSSMNLQGLIPEAFTNENITVLDLSNNYLNGTISTLWILPSVTYLNLSGNQFYGLLPASTSWAMIETIDLSRNLFIGKIPVNFGKEATRLQLLDLSSNNFTGTIPSYLGNFTYLQSLDLSNNRFDSGIPDTFGDVDFVYDDSLRIYRPASFSGLLYLNLSRCNLNGTMSEKIGNLRRLSVLDLSHNQLSGNISDLHQTKLVALDLSDNKLSGEVPEYLAELPLEALNLGMNHLTGYLPDSFFTHNLTNCSMYSFFPGNNLFASCMDGFVVNFPRPPPPSSPTPPPAGKGCSLALTAVQSKVSEYSPLRPYAQKRLPVYAIPVIVAGSMLLIFLAAIAAYLCIFKKQEHFITKKINEHTVKFLPMQVISEATDNFSESNALGAGAFGTVYKGIAKNGELWAVKRAKNASVESLEQFKNEVEIISRMNHKNLVKLFGFCHTDTEQILVYEFIENGTLKSALKRGEGTINPVLTIEQRVNIALGAAEGLRYLHTQAKPTIIHRDVKADNILLDANMQAKVCDFGLLKDNEDKEELAKRTAVAGTYGYMDPEYYSTYRVTAKSDVYSFGVVILELITGQEAILEEITGDGVYERISLANWALKMMRSTLGLSAIVDPSLDANYSLDDMNVLASVAASCLQKNSMYRPEMADVASHLRLLKTKMENKDSQVMGNNGLILLPREEVVEEEGPIYPIFSSKGSSVNSGALSNSSFFRPVPKGSVLLAR